MEKQIEQLRDINLDIEELKKRKEEIKQKALEHRDTKTVDEATAEVEKINRDIAKLEQRKIKIQEENKNLGENRTMENIVTERKTADIMEQRMQLAKQLKEKRTMTIDAAEVRATLIATEGVAKPTVVDGVRQPFNVLVNILDQVKVVNRKGAGAYKVSFKKTHSAATTKTDGTAQTPSDPTFGTVTITPTQIAVTSYVSTEIENVSPIDYYSEVRNSASIAVRLKLAQDILTKIKSSTDDESSPAAMYDTLTASASNGLLTSSSPAGKIDANTLRRIVMSYGGDANVYGSAVLYLNKNDLIAFGDVRGTNEKRAIYEITPNAANPNIGIIRDGGLSVPYCICPTLTAHADTAQTTSAIQTMIYGAPLNYELALFGDLQVKVSEDYKFAEGLYTILAKATVGGSIVVPNGFVVVTIPASA